MTKHGQGEGGEEEDEITVTKWGFRRGGGRSTLQVVFLGRRERNLMGGGNGRIFEEGREWGGCRQLHLTGGKRKLRKG